MIIPSIKKLSSIVSLGAQLFIICCLSHNTFAQRTTQYNIENISTEVYQLEKGLTQNSVRCIFEDRKGYMWFGTWEGLNRYDGTEFKHFFPSIDAQESSIIQQTINTIIQDNNDDIWVGTDAGLSKINYSSFEVKNYTNLGTKNSDTIHALYQDERNRIWIGTQRGIVILDLHTDSLFPINKFHKDIAPLEIAEIRLIKFINNQLWVATGDGLYFLEKDEKGEYDCTRIGGLTDEHITSLMPIADTTVLIGTENGLNLYRFSDKNIVQYKTNNRPNGLKSYVIMALLLDNNDQIWIGTSGGGVNIYDIASSSFIPIRLNEPSSSPFKDNSTYEPYIYSLYQSRNGIIWIGSAWRGLLKVNKKHNIFEAFRSSPDNRNGLSDNHIWSFANNDSLLFIGTESGVNIYDFNKHKFSYLTKKEGLSSNLIRSIYVDSKGQVWIGTFNGGLNCYNLIDKSNIIYSTNGDSSHRISDNTIWMIIEDSLNNMWFGTYGGLNKLDPNTGEITYYQSNDNDSNSLSNNIVYCSSIGEKGKIWIGTNNGLNEFDPSTGKFKVYKRRFDDSTSLSNNRIFSIYDDKKGNLWLGTVGGGLNKFNKKTKEVNWFTTSDGLPNNVVYASVPDDYGNLWLSTNHGVCRFNINTKSTTLYGVNDGLLSNELNKGAFLSDFKGNIYFGGMFGFNVFNPNQLIQNTEIPKVVISSLDIYGKNPIYDINSGTTIELEYDQNDFTIRYAVLDFNNPQKNMYKHRLVGYDRDWEVTSSNHPIASYSRVIPGEYSFQIIGANNDGVWCESPFIINIVITPPWYRHLFFRISIIIALIFIVSLFIRFRIKRLNAKHKIEKQMLEMEGQALRLQMNPHFIFNTLNSIQAFILKNKTEESITYLSKFSRLVRAILNNSQESIISLKQELDVLRAYLELEKLRFENRFRFNINISQEIDSEFVGIAPMLVQPYVENAILHGVGPRKDKNGEIDIDFTIEDSYLKCVITDNGVGRDFHKKNKTKHSGMHKSRGMHLTKNRLELLDTNTADRINVEIIDLFNENNKAIGTRIVLFITFEEL